MSRVVNKEQCLYFLPLSLIERRFGISMFIIFIMYLEIIYI